MAEPKPPPAVVTEAVKDLAASSREAKAAFVRARKAMRPAKLPKLREAVEGMTAARAARKGKSND